MSDSTYLNVSLPKHLRERARKIAKSMKLSSTALVVLALQEKVEAIEAKRREEEDRARAEKEAKRSSRRLQPLEKLATRLPRDEEEDVKKPDEIYIKQARYIAEAMRKGDTRETRLRLAESVQAIKKYYPFTHADDISIHRKLERAIKTLPEAEWTAPKPERVEDEHVGRTLNTTALRSFGNVVNDEEESP